MKHDNAPPAGKELLRLVYRYVDFDRLLQDNPTVTREQVDELFRSLAGFAPDASRLVIHVEGGSRGNPGPAGIGVFITDAAGAVVDEIHRYIGETTNNVAEYEALIAAAERAIELKAGEVVLRADSQLIVKQIRGEYRVRSRDLMPLVARAQKLLQKIPRWSIEHIRREENTRADQLANLAMDCAE